MGHHGPGSPFSTPSSPDGAGKEGGPSSVDRRGPRALATGGRGGPQSSHSTDVGHVPSPDRANSP